MNELIQILKEPVNDIFLILMFGLFISSIYKMKKNPKQHSTLPNLIAALGIIGTFVGILLGLLDFDANSIDTSIPNLLEGMKTAFITSIVGLVLSNILKSLQSWMIKREKTEQIQEDISLTDIANIMLDIKESIVTSNDKVIDTVREMKNSNIQISKNNEAITVNIMENIKKIFIENTNDIIDSITEINDINREEFEEKKTAMYSLIDSISNSIEVSISTNIKDLKESIHISGKSTEKALNVGFEGIDGKFNNLIYSNEIISTKIEGGNNILINEFRNFAKTMAENNMKVFIEAIQECIKDLNTQLKDQFGENFKQLNLSVEKLLEWQKHYKETIELTNKNQEILYKSMDSTKELATEIIDKTASIIEIVNKLGDKIVTFDSQQKSLTVIIENLNKLSADTEKLVPSLENCNNLITTNFENISTSIEKLSNISVDSIKKQQDEIAEVLENFRNTITASSDLNIKSVERQIESLDKAATKLETESFNLTQKIADNIQNMVENNNSNLQTSVNNINELLTTTLNTSLESLGEQLATVSEKFVKDYTPLTIELQKLVELSKGKDKI